MRKSNREIKNRDEIFAVLNRCDVVRLAINTPDYPYIVPMNFGVETEGDSIILWFHCAHEGLKLENIKKDRRVGFEADCSHKLIPGDEACSYTMEYESIIGCGDISIQNGNDIKRRGLKSIMRHYEPEKEFTFPDAVLTAVCILRLDVKQITGKRLVK